MSKKKLALSISFYLIGTILIGYLGVVMAGNFYRDSRVFAKADENLNPTPSISVTPAVYEESPNPTFGADSDGVFKYRRAADVFVKEFTPSPAREDGLNDPEKKKLTPTKGKDLSPTKAGEEDDENDLSPTKGKRHRGTPAPTDKANSKLTPTKAPDGEEHNKNGKPVIEVINKSGNNELTHEIRAALEGQGYKVKASNVEAAVSVKTQIIDRKGGDIAANVRGLLKTGQISKNVDPNSKVDVTIIIGDDYK